MARKKAFTSTTCPFAAMVCFICAALSSSLVSHAIGDVSTTRDERGIWFIQAAPDTPAIDVFEAMGYAVATDRLWQAEVLRRQARGRLAEIFGEDYLQTDIFMRSIAYTEEELQDGLESLNDYGHSVVSGYVQGFNRRIEVVTADPGLMPFEFTTLSKKLGIPVIPKPWSETDVLALITHIQRSFDPEALETGQLDNLKLLRHLQTVVPDQAWAMFEDLRWRNDGEAETYINPWCSAQQHPQPLTTDGIQLQARAQTAARLSTQRRQMFDGLEAINARIRMGSYAWVVSGEHTQSGHPILYAGPQMGFSAPAIVTEGSIRGAGMAVSGMTIPGAPLIIIGRTPHHAWSMQVGHAHTTDYYFHTDPLALDLEVRHETIQIAGAAAMTLPFYRSQYGPVITPQGFDPTTYTFDGTNPIVSWRYAHWGYEFKSLEGFLQLALADTMDAFGDSIEKIAVSQHFCYADRNGNIAYWMSGRNPVRQSGEWRLPQGSLPGIAPSEWVGDELLPRATDRNPAKGYFAGWNNKSHADYDNAYNNIGYMYGPFHRSHTIYDFLEPHVSNLYGRKLSFEQLRELAVQIATTDSVALGGNPWPPLAPHFQKAIFSQWWQSGNWRRKIQRLRALWLLQNWDGYFVAGESDHWTAGSNRAEAWMLLDAWLHEVLRLTFGDELEGYLEANENSVMGAKRWPAAERAVLLNVLLHALDFGGDIINQYDWFDNIADGVSGQQKIITAALDNALDHLGQRPWGINQRSWITHKHTLLGQVWRTPFASRSTYAQVVEMGPDGPVRIESMFPQGQSGHISTSATGEPELDPHFLSMTNDFDDFTPREFPLFE